MNIEIPYWNKIGRDQNPELLNPVPGIDRNLVPYKLFIYIDKQGVWRTTDKAVVEPSHWLIRWPEVPMPEPEVNLEKQQVLDSLAHLTEVVKGWK